MKNRELYLEIDDDIHSGRLALPMLPDVAFKVQEIASDPDSGINDLVDIVKTDASLAARLIKVVNSPLFRAARPGSLHRYATNY